MPIVRGKIRHSVQPRLQPGKESIIDRVQQVSAGDIALYRGLGSPFRVGVAQIDRVSMGAVHHYKSGGKGQDQRSGADHITCSAFAFDELAKSGV